MAKVNEVKEVKRVKVIFLETHYTAPVGGTCYSKDSVHDLEEGLSKVLISDKVAKEYKVK